MSIGKRISFFRNKRNMTQKQLGIMIGFPERSADIRMAQYEAGTRTPKADVTEKIAASLNVSPYALTAPELDTYNGLMHTLFALEDMYGIEISDIDGEVCLRMNRNHPNHKNVAQLLINWHTQMIDCRDGVLSEEEYEAWKYRYPEFDTFDFMRYKQKKKEEIKKELSD